MISSAALSVLRWLARRDSASAPSIGAACAMSPGEVRSRLTAMESLRRVASRQDKATVPPRRVYYVTGEGRRAAGIIDARMQDVGRSDPSGAVDRAI